MAQAALAVVDGAEFVQERVYFPPELAERLDRMARTMQKIRTRERTREQQKDPRFFMTREMWLTSTPEGRKAYSDLMKLVNKGATQHETINFIADRFRQWKKDNGLLALNHGMNRRLIPTAYTMGMVIKMLVDEHGDELEARLNEMNGG